MQNNSPKFQQTLEQLFTYHPPKNEAEQEQHRIVNEATIEYAKALAKVISNPAELTTILREIQKVRMLANASVCYARVGINYRDLFEAGSTKTKITEGE